MIQRKPASILLTDDESNIRLLLRRSLETEGYAISEAADGRAALQTVERDRPDLMILDLNMPQLDGMAVLEQLNALAIPNRPRVIVLTAFGSIRTAVRATQLGAADFLEKPVTPLDLRTAVRGLLSEPDIDSLPAKWVELPDGYEQVLVQIRKSLRLVQLETAETLLSRAADYCGQQTAAYFNLLGILYETQHRWRLARKCYGKAIDSDNDYEPAKTNFRRLSDLKSAGRSSLPISLGDEADQPWFAQLSQHTKG